MISHKYNDVQLVTWFIESTRRLFYARIWVYSGIIIRENCSKIKVMSSYISTSSDMSVTSLSQLPSWGGIIFSSEVGAQLLLFNSLVQRSNSDMYCFQCVLHYGAKMAIKNMCTSQKNTQRDTEPWDWIRHHTLCWVQLIRRTTSLFNGCQRRICPGLKPRLPAATRAVRT